MKKYLIFELVIILTLIISYSGFGQSSSSFQLKNWSISNGGGSNNSASFQMKESAIGGISLGMCTSTSFSLNGGMLITTVKDSSLLYCAAPSVFKVLQNYPNPFNPTTTIHYSLPKEANVQIYIINSFGQTIRTLSQNLQQPGAYQIIWDGKDKNGQPVSSGLYYYQIIADGFKEVRKMMLLK